MHKVTNRMLLFALSVLALQPLSHAQIPEVGKGAPGPVTAQHLAAELISDSGCSILRGHKLCSGKRLKCLCQHRERNLVSICNIPRRVSCLFVWYQRQDSGNANVGGLSVGGMFVRSSFARCATRSCSN
jgi:hypothetical protein